MAARLLGGAAQIWAFSGRGEIGFGWSTTAVAWARESGDRGALIASLVGRSVANVFAGHRGDMRVWFDEVLQLAREDGDMWTIAVYASGMAGGLASIDPAGAEAVLLEAIDAARHTRNPYAIGMASMAQGRLAGAYGRGEEARRWFDEAIARFAELGDERLVLACRSDLAHALRHAGSLDAALDIYRVTIGGWVRLGNRGAVANQLENIAFIAIARDDPERAAALLGAAESLRELAASPMGLQEVPEYDDLVGRLRATGDLGTVAAGWQAGRALSMADAVALATG